MSKATVCFVHGDALDLFRGENGPRFGGSETQVYLLARLLADSGEFDVRLVADKDVGDAHYPGITFRETPPPIQRGLPVVSRMVNRARGRRPYADLDNAVLVQTILGPYTLSTWMTARGLGLKFVYRMSCDADIDGSFFPPDAARSYHEAVQDADGVIAQTPLQQKRLRAELAVESTLLTSIVDLPADGPALGGSYVLWAGRGAPIKRPWIMVETARVLPDIEFVMLMPEGETVVDRLFWRCIAQEAAHVPNLKLLRGVSHFEIASYYRNASVFVNTSAIEGLPSAFLQSAAQGTPIVSLDVDPDGILESAGMGHCSAGDLDGFRSAIAGYAANPSRVREQGSAAFEYVKRHHSAETVGPVAVQFFHSVLRDEQ